MKPLAALLVLLLSSGSLAQLLGRIPKIENMPCVKEGYGYQDPNVKHVNGGYVANAGTCHHSCSLFPHCYAFTWYKSSKECWFYGKGLELQEVPGAVGGPWECPSTTAGALSAAAETTTAGAEQADAASVETDDAPAPAPGPAPSEAVSEPEQASTTASAAAAITSVAAGAAPEPPEGDGSGPATEEPPADEAGPPAPAPAAGVPAEEAAVADASAAAELAPNGTLPAPVLDPQAAGVEAEGSPPSPSPSAGGADVIPAVADGMPVAIPESSTQAPSSQANSTGSVGAIGNEEEPGDDGGSTWFPIVLLIVLIGLIGAVIFVCLMKALSPDEDDDEHHEEEEEKEHGGRRGKRKGKKTRAVEPAYGHVDVTDTHHDGEEVVDLARMSDNEQYLGADYGELYSERSLRFPAPMMPPFGASLDTSSLSTGSFRSWPQAPTRGLTPPPLLSPLIQPPQLLSPLPAAAAPTPFTLSAPWHSASTSSLGPPQVVYSNSPATSFAPLQGPPSPYPVPVQALPTSFVAMVPPSPNPAPRFHTDSLFDMLDTNRDGVLSRSEVAYLFP